MRNKKETAYVCRRYGFLKVRNLVKSSTNIVNQVRRNVKCYRQKKI